MPLPGGPTDKLGNRYELWWTVSQLVQMLHGQAESIRIEDPGITKAEFVITRQGRRELHQAKRSHQDGKWSLASLAGADVQLLQAVFSQLAGNDARFVFASTSDARELAELADRARHAESAQEFESQFLNAKQQKANFEKLSKHWNNVTAGGARDILRRIEVRTLDERSLEEHVRWGLCALFLNDPDAVCAELRRVAEDSIHKTITREALVAHLAERGFRLRRLARLGAASALVSEVTDRYLAGVRKKLIRSSLIPRAATQTLLGRIGGDVRGSDSVLTGKAGSGKTACVVELAETLRTRGVAVLAFRLDRLEPVSTTAELGQQLGLEESPTLVLAAAAAGREAVLIVDQLDAVSTASGRSSDFLDAIEGLLAEARGLRGNLKLHAVVVCRAFDWENDHRLRRMLSEQHTKVEVAEFSPDELKAVLSAEHFRTELFQPRQFELLRLPQNLSLFLDAGFDPSIAPRFNTAKELFDRYWETKRRAVAARAAPLLDQWTDVIQLLCDEMTLTQQLSVPREKLDRFAADYVAQMASEGVLTFDGQRYGFGHESFFDYCFSRAFVAKDQSLTEFLTASEQHLFRRAQVRQVLAYLRDANPQRYCVAIRALLADSRVRTHLKDVAVALVASVPDPADDEWAVLEPWLNSELAAFASGQRNPDKLATLVWHHFFASQSWFHLVDRRGLIAGWLASPHDRLTTMAINYLRFHQRHSGDRVAELLEPYVGKGGDWTHRLRYMMEWADHETSRRFFELFLRLIDDGTLDDARDRFASNGTSWSMLYGLVKTRPDWVPEVIAHWLRRRAVLLQQDKADDEEANWQDLFGSDRFGSEDFHDAATKSPAIFAQHVLPVVLEITDAALYKDKTEPPRRDAVWPVIFESEHESMDSSCLSSLVAALEKLAREHPSELGSTIAELRTRVTFIANYLLLGVYTAGATYFADEAVGVLCAEPWRLHCGFSDSPYWVVMKLIKAVAPLCSTDNREKLEAAILSYASAYERTAKGHKLAGRARYALLSAIPAEHRSKNAQARFEELERKFGAPEEPPRGIHVYEVGSPISKTAADKMTDEQWLKAIAKYQSEEHLRRWEEPEKGGADELAGMLGEYVRNEAERFVRLSLRFPLGTNPVYIERTLEGLRGSSVPTDLKLSVCRKAYSESRAKCGKAVGDLLRTIEEPLPDDTVQMLDWLATEHPDPEKELWCEEATNGKPYYGGDILTHGINTTRGRAAEAIRDLINGSVDYIPRFRGTVERLVEDKSLSVRACAASTLLALARWDTPLALGLFHKLAATDERLLGTHYAEQFIYHGLREHFSELQTYVERMLRSPIADLSQAGARLVSLAFLLNQRRSHRRLLERAVTFLRRILRRRSGEQLVNQAIRGTAAQRKGIAMVAAANLAYADCRAWCEARLLNFFNDADPEVRRQAASCFRHLEKQPLDSYERLIGAFCDSAAFQEDSFPILHVLEDSLRRLPGTTCVVCERFLARFSDEAKDIRTHRAADAHTVAKLLFRTYQQHQRDEWASRCLDLIDKMCLEGISDVKSGLDEFER